MLPGVTYHTSRFSPRINFTVRDPWWVIGADATGFLMNPGVSETEEENLGFGDVEQVFEPSNQRVLVKAPKDLVGWFVHHPGLRFPVKPHPVEIGGVRGTEFDIELSNTAPLCPPNPNLSSGARCEYFFWPSGHGNPFSPANVANGPPPGIYTTTHGDTERDRLVILYVQGHTLIISWGDYPDVFAANVRLFEEVIQTIRPDERPNGARAGHGAVHVGRLRRWIHLAGGLYDLVPAVPKRLFVAVRSATGRGPERPLARADVYDGRIPAQRDLHSSGSLVAGRSGRHLDDHVPGTERAGRGRGDLPGRRSGPGTRQSARGG